MKKELNWKNPNKKNAALVSFSSIFPTSLSPVPLPLSLELKKPGTGEAGDKRLLSERTEARLCVCARRKAAARARIEISELSRAPARAPGNLNSRPEQRRRREEPPLSRLGIWKVIASPL